MRHENTEYCDCDNCVAKSNWESIEASPTSNETVRIVSYDTMPCPPPAPSGRWPILESIGILGALDEVEAVAASNADKHGRKWITKTISHHDAKAIKHLGTVQCGEPFDHETGKRGRAHAALRLLMALGLELLGAKR